MKNIFFNLGLIFLLSLNFSSAVFVESVNVPKFLPGQEGVIRIQVENIFKDDVKDLTISLDFSNVPFTPIGSSEDSVDELEEEEEEDFVFTIKAANDVKPGDYQLPYILTFERLGNAKTRTGSIGVRVGSDTELSYSVNTNMNVVKEQGEISLKVVNTGFGDIKFVNVKVFPEGFTLLSDDEVYIGTVDSDDFETATFDVIFNDENAKLKALVEYKDFDNKKIADNIVLSLTVYSREEALELGIIENSNTLLIISIIIFIVLLWILYRVLRKRKRIKESTEGR